MDKIEMVKAYYQALDSPDLDQVSEYLADDYQLVDFMPRPMDKTAMLNLVRALRTAMPNLGHSLSNIRLEESIVRLTVQRSGTNSGHLDLRGLGIGVIQRTEKFIIFPNGTYEIIFRDGKIAIERDISPQSPNRRMTGMLKAFGIDIAALSTMKVLHT